jgi:dTDP-4-amino-4,6-dideoxy-D-glucose acyltransferase
MAMLDRSKIEEMGFARVGNFVSISDRASFYNCSRIVIGNHVRIDDFCVLSAGPGGIFLGSYIHLAVYSSLIGSGAIRLGDFANISSKVAIYSSSDDFSGEWMTNPTVSEEYTGVIRADVSVGRHVIVGSGSVILPGVVVGDGAAIGALSLVKHECEEFGMYAGTPAKRIGTRLRRVLDLEKEFMSDERLGQSTAQDVKRTSVDEH